MKNTIKLFTSDNGFISFLLTDINGVKKTIPPIELSKLNLRENSTIQEAYKAYQSL